METLSNDIILNVQKIFLVLDKCKNKINNEDLLNTIDNIYSGFGLPENKKLRSTVKRSQRIRWEDGKTAFASRIRTGLIINFLHIDPVEFLKDSFYLFKPRIINQLKKQSIIKYFKTRNNLIDLRTDLSDWYKNNIYEKLLNELFEFQKGQSGMMLNRIESLE
ncbi:hypothetical protein NQ318_022548, partial [Aromia moschata]